MKDLQELKNQIKNYFNYMFENKSKEEMLQNMTTILFYILKHFLKK